MPAFAPTPPLYTRYRAALANRIVLGIFLPPMLLAIGYGLVAGWSTANLRQASTLALAGGMLLVGAFLLHILVATFKSAVFLTNGRITKQNVWPLANKELLLGEVAGFRTTGKLIIIEPIRPDLPTLRLDNSIEFHDDLLFWLGSNYPDLDHAEAEATRAALLADEQLGGTPEDRANRLTLAKRVGGVLSALGGVVGLWLFIRPQPYPYAIAAGVALPLLAAGALFAFPRLMRLEAGKNSPHASISLALLLPSFGLLVRALADSDPIDHATVWPVAGGLAVAFGLLLAAGSQHSLLEHGTLRRGSGGEWLLLLMCAAAYGYGTALTVNAAFDKQAPTLYRVRVLNKHRTHGKSTTYYLQITPWGPHATSEDVTVSSDYYERTQLGDSATVVTRPGCLGISWFKVIPH